jgi:hypothetical protein
MWCGECYTPPTSFKFHRCLPKDESGVDWGRSSDLERHLYGRPGDHLVTPFQCDLCIFRLLKGRNPGTLDTEVMDCIRQVNLDALWGRESGTVLGTRRAVKQTLEIWKRLGLEPTFESRGPFPNRDSFGYSVAIAMITKSREKGRYESYQQFETIRKLRMGFSSTYASSPSGVEALRTFGGDTAKFHLNLCPTNSLWFERFSKGCLSRMGQIVKQDLAISVGVMLMMQELLEGDWSQAQTQSRKALVANVGAYISIAFCGSFRGAEVFLVDHFGLRKYYDMDLSHNGDMYVIVPLLGRFKSEIGLAYHLTPLAAESASGIKVKTWIKRLLEVRLLENRRHGPAFVNDKGIPLGSLDMEEEVIDLLLRVQDRDKTLIPADINVSEEYGISRSFRRGATSEARARGVPPDIIELVNRWRNYEGAKGRKPKAKMMDHYTDIRLSIPTLIRFSKSL